MSEKLSEIDITAAEQVNDRSHPVIEVLARNLNKIQALNKQLSEVSNADKAGRAAIIQQYAFIADELAAISEPFTLQPLELVSIWSYLITLIPDYNARYNLARPIVAAYAVQGLKKPWDTYPRQTGFQSVSIPEDLKNEKNLAIVLERIKAAEESLAELVQFAYGYLLDNASVTETVKRLSREAVDNTEAAEQLEQLMALEAAMEEKHPNLGAIQDAFKIAVIRFEIGRILGIEE